MLRLLAAALVLLSCHTMAEPLKAQRGLGQAPPPVAAGAGLEEVGRSIYRASFEGISTPEMARDFIERYRDQDPEGLTAKALRRGYERGIAESKACITFSRKTIDAEKEIGRTVGYVDKAALYQAGRNMLICRNNLERYQAEVAKSR